MSTPTISRFSGPFRSAPGGGVGLAVTGVLVALVLLAVAGEGLFDQVVPDPSLPPPLRPVGPDLVDWIRVAGWAGVCFAALVGLRRVAAGLAWVAVAAWAVLVAPGVADQPAYVVQTLPQFALAVVAAVALSVPAPPRRAVAVLGVRRLAALVLASLVVLTILELNRLTAVAYDATGWYASYVLYDLEARSRLVLWAYVAGLAAAAVAIVAALATLARQVRRRIPVMLAPVAALALVIEKGLAGWRESSFYLGRIPLVPAQWAVLVLVPAVTFLAGALLVRRREETLRMLALGRDADRERPAS
ncbi:hypothetical protein [Micromonospora globispora]|uniref:hypothetical protein n=1 Tax=Micromonospora globispora TaxID=1450148 RepID=UPI001FAFFB64|nr:hypothetical protein [Micromonospora globispora]